MGKDDLKLHMIYNYDIMVLWYWITNLICSVCIYCCVTHRCFQYLPFPAVDSPLLSKTSFTQSLQTRVGKKADKHRKIKKSKRREEK